MSRSARTKRTVAGAVVLIGVILLISSLFLGWWSYQISAFGDSDTATFGLPTTSPQVSISCSGPDAACPSSETYSSYQATNTGNLYASVQYLLLGGLALGVVGAIVSLLSRGRQRLVQPALILIILALIVALLAPIHLLLAQPGAIAQDYSTSGNGNLGGGSNGTSPANSFWGSTSGSGATATWGPSPGWYLAVVGGVILIGGFALLFSGRKPESMNWNWTAPPEVASGGPAGGPTRPQ